MRALVPGDDPILEIADEDSVVGIEHQGGQPQHGFFRELPVVDIDECHYGALGPASFGLAFVGPIRPKNEGIPTTLNILDLQLLDMAGLDHVQK